MGDRKVVSPVRRQIADSILRHLQKMLNARQGTTVIAPDYGMPDVTNLVRDLPEAVDAFRAAIKNSIERYEPRLRKPIRVVFIPGDSDWPNLRFEITAALTTNGDGREMHFETTVEPSGHVSVKG